MLEKSEKSEQFNTTQMEAVKSVSKVDSAGDV